MPRLIRLSKSVLNLLFVTLYILLSGLWNSAMALEDVKKEPAINSIEKKIAKGYSNKFCNAIGIGLSSKSAIRLAIDENKDPKFNPSLWIDLAFSTDKEIPTLDNDKLALIISKNVVNSCGYPIGLSGEKGIKEFKDFFLEAKADLGKN